MENTRDYARLAENAIDDAFEADGDLEGESAAAYVALAGVYATLAVAAASIRQ